jgi:predicted amidohydrolase
VSSNSFKLALLQLQIEPGESARNLDRALDFTGRAASAGASVVLLPEALPFGWMDPIASAEAEPIPGGKSCERFREAAKCSRIFICTGLVERADDKIFNSAVLIGPQGELLLHHRKIYELGMAHSCYALGDRLTVADTPLGRIGVMICADGFAPGQAIARTLALMGAQIILSPCAWAVAPEHDNLREPYGKLWLDSYGAVARDFPVWIAGCSNVGPIRNGPWTGHKCIGASLVVAPGGAKRLQAPYGDFAEEIIYTEITPQAVPRCDAS